MLRGSIIELVDRDEALRMDAVNVRMARTQTVVRLAVGEALFTLGNGWQELGFSRFVDYVRERVERTGRWGEDTRAVAGRLMRLPRIRRALLRGDIGWCMAALLSRHATAEDEEELLDATRGMTVRQVKKVLAERGAQDPSAEERRFGTLDVTLDFDEAWLLLSTKPMIEALDGSSDSGAWLESLLAEGQCALSNVAPGVDLTPEDVARKQMAWLSSIRLGKERMDAREERAESSLPPMPELEVDERIEEPPSGPLSIDRRSRRELAPRLASYDLAFGRALAKFFAVRGWKVLGFASEKQYAVERLGMSRSSVYARIRLATRAVHLEKVGEALHAGKIGSEAASLIMRVATPDTEEAWIDRATRRTHKHFKQEVVAAERIAKMMNTGEPPGPPSNEEIDIVLALDRDMKCGAYARRALGMEREDDAPEHLDRAVSRAPDSLPAEMAREALAVQENLRSLILLAREQAGSLTIEQAEAACTGVTEPEGPFPTIDLEDEVEAPVVRMFGAADAFVTSEATVAEGAAWTAAEGATAPVVRMFGPADPTTAGDAMTTDGVPSMIAGSAAPVVRMFGPADSLSAEEPQPEVVQMFGAADPATTGDAGPVDLLTWRSAPAAEHSTARREMLRRWGVVTLRIRAEEETILHYRMLKAAFERAGIGGSFARFLVASFWVSWGPVLGRTNRCEAILRRDGYDCTCPVCGAQAGPGSHHLWYRSHGGGDEDWNQTSPCPFCHLDGEHGGRLKVRGEAPDLTWLIGRIPIMEVRGRERRELAA